MLGGLAHAHGWPMVRGGTQQPRERAGVLPRGPGRHRRHRLPRHLTRRAPAPPGRDRRHQPAPAGPHGGDRLDPRGRRRLERFRHGPGACKVDFALAGPVPWTNEEARRAGTVHLAGTYEELALSEKIIAAGGHPDRPFVLVAQQSLFDDTRAPAGKHTLWAYAHVPNGSTLDVSERITDQIERFAPGFRDLVIDKHVITAADVRAATTRPSSGATSAAAPTAGRSCCSGRGRRSTPTPRRSRACSCARRRRRPGAACTACAAPTPPGPPCAGSGSSAA